LLTYRQHIKEAARAAVKRRGGLGGRLPKPPKPKEPTALSRRYLAEILPWLRYARALVNAPASMSTFKRALKRTNERRAAARGDSLSNPLSNSLSNSTPLVGLDTRLDSLGHETSHGHESRLDDDVGDVQKQLGDIRFAFQRRYSKAEAEQLAARHAAKGRAFSAEQIQESFRKVIGIDVIAVSPAI
jgi:hypothetical protein